MYVDYKYFLCARKLWAACVSLLTQNWVLVAHYAIFLRALKSSFREKRMRHFKEVQIPKLVGFHWIIVRKTMLLW